MVEIIIDALTRVYIEAELRKRDCDAVSFATAFRGGDGRGRCDMRRRQQEKNAETIHRANHGLCSKWIKMHRDK